MPSSQLFVGGFPYETTQEELEALFKSCGTVVRVKILLDRETERSRGLAFIEMSSDAEAKAAIAKLHDSMVGFRKIFVSEARPREERPGGFSGSVERRSGQDRRRARGAGEFTRPPKPSFGEGSFERKDRPPFSGGKKKWGDKPSGPRKPWGDKPGGPKKSWGDKPGGPKKPWGDKPGGPKKSWGDKPGGPKKPWGDKSGGKPRRFGPPKNRDR